MKSVMKHQFSVVPKAEIPRSTFDRSHGHKTTINAGLLYSLFVDEALPGDTFNLSATLLARLSTPIFPLMDNMYIDTQWFACPIRLIWDNWQRFNGEQRDPADSTDFLVPQFQPHSVAEGDLSDYMGLPVGTAAPISYNSLWHRAYNLAYQQWYKDQNLIDAPVLNYGDGPDDPADYPIRRRGKRHDYFTSCLPWPQKGQSVSIPLGDNVQIIPSSPGAAPTFSHTAGGQQIIATPSRTLVASVAAGSDSAMKWESPALKVDTSSGIATINQLRQAFAVQKMFERDARGGTRYVEILKAHWGVTSPDHRHQRVEFLGGSSTPINVTPVPQTSGTPGDKTNNPTPQGNLAAYGLAEAHGHGFTKSFTEHCVILGIVSVRADLTYQQGIPRMFSRQTRFDFYWPALSHIGEQAVLRKEIFATGTPAEDDLVFGYQERHAEYRYKPSIITGKMRSAATGTLDAWHLSQDFATAPVLDQAFIEENPPIDRVVAVPSEPHFILDSYIKCHCARPMPIYGVPGLIDHF